MKIFPARDLHSTGFKLQRSYSLEKTPPQNVIVSWVNGNVNHEECEKHLR